MNSQFKIPVCNEGTLRAAVGYTRRVRRCGTCQWFAASGGSVHAPDLPWCRLLDFRASPTSYCAEWADSDGPARADGPLSAASTALWQQVAQYVEQSLREAVAAEHPGNPAEFIRANGKRVVDRGTHCETFTIGDVPVLVVHDPSVIRGADGGMVLTATARRLRPVPQPPVHFTVNVR